MVIYTAKNFDYTGTIQTYSVPVSGLYKLEAYGAQGGTDSTNGGKGGYAYGEIVLQKGQILYICVGSNVGYNGGGSGHGRATDSGGGATHIALSTGLLTSFSSNIPNLLIVAGGGGGIGRSPGGAGGGLSGSIGSGSRGGGGGGGGTQTAGGLGQKNGSSGVFGKGGSNTAGPKSGGGGGGGGFYGGGAGGSDYSSFDDYDDSGGGGGSSYIAKLKNSGTTAGLKIGHGYATIKPLIIPPSAPKNLETNLKERHFIKDEIALTWGASIDNESLSVTYRIEGYNGTEWIMIKDKIAETNSVIILPQDLLKGKLNNRNAYIRITAESDKGAISDPLTSKKFTLTKIAYLIEDGDKLKGMEKTTFKNLRE